MKELDVNQTDVQPSGRLVELEGVIERGLKTVVEVGDALREIRDGKLYKEHYSTFEDYCQDRWGWTRQRAFQQIQAVHTIEALTTRVNIPPNNERQARVLNTLANKDPDAAAEVWQQAVEEHGVDVTAGQLRKIVKEKLPVPLITVTPGPPIKVTPTWTSEELDLFERMRGGETVVVNMRESGHPNLVKWAKDAGLFVKVDRNTDWGNPFTLEDGGRDTIVEYYEWLYFPRKSSLHARRSELEGGKALGCWCAPKRCHADFLKEWVEGAEEAD